MYSADFTTDAHKTENDLSLELLEAVNQNDDVKTMYLAKHGVWNLEAANIAKIKNKTTIHQMILKNHPAKRNGVPIASKTYLDTDF